MATVTMSKNPVFQSITGLTNTTFDPDNYREDRMATEAQIRQVEQAIGDLQARKEHCCKEIVTWRSYVRVVAENTGIVLSDWLDNMQVGTIRRGEPFTVEFALPHDATKFFDDRSNYAIRNPPNSNNDGNFHIVTNTPGKALALENEFIAKAVGNYTDNYSNTGGFHSSGSGKWTGITLNNYNDIIFIDSLLNGEPTKPLPFMSVSPVAGYYYTYKDFTTNKIKIDVKRRDQFADGEYLALFFIQFVQRNGYTG